MEKESSIIGDTDNKAKSVDSILKIASMLKVNSKAFTGLVDRYGLVVTAEYFIRRNGIKVKNRFDDDKRKKLIAYINKYDRYVGIKYAATDNSSDEILIVLYTYVSSKISTMSKDRIEKLKFNAPSTEDILKLRGRLIDESKYHGSLAELLQKLNYASEYRLLNKVSDIDEYYEIANKLKLITSKRMKSNSDVTSYLVHKPGTIIDRDLRNINTFLYNMGFKHNQLATADMALNNPEGFERLAHIIYNMYKVCIDKQRLTVMINMMLKVSCPDIDMRFKADDINAADIVRVLQMCSKRRRTSLTIKDLVVVNSTVYRLVECIVGMDGMNIDNMMDGDISNGRYALLAKIVIAIEANIEYNMHDNHILTFNINNDAIKKNSSLSNKFVVDKINSIYSTLTGSNISDETLFILINIFRKEHGDESDNRKWVI